MQCETVCTTDVAECVGVERIVQQQSARSGRPAAVVSGARSEDGPVS